MHRTGIRILLSAALAWHGATAAADPGRGLPLWEAGLAGGLGRVSDYPAADQAHLRGIVLPVLIYRGKVLRVDQSGIRGRLFASAQWEADVSATAAFNAQDNSARAGMPGLDYLFGIGPQAVYKGLQQRSGGPTLHLKLRALMSTDLRRVDARGYSFDPELRWRASAPPWLGGDLTLWLQPTWASRTLHRYFYEVTPGQATPTRPAYTARAGYLGSEAGVTLVRRPEPTWSWFVTARFMSLHGSANTASPLFRDRGNLNIGAGIVWTPWRSSVTVAD